MGNETSRVETANVEDPFPVSTSLDRDLDRLSMVAARVLSTPDIYDVENLAKPGVCGEYAVFLKRELEKDIKKILKPYVMEVDLDGKGIKERVEIAYGNPRKIIKNEKAREAICKSLSSAMVRTIATIVACLASIQVAVPARKTTVSGIGSMVGGQRGGTLQSVYDWLVTNQYVVPGSFTSPLGQKLKMRINPSSQTFSKKIDFTITLSTTAGSTTTGTIESSGATPEGPMPTGSLKVQFLDPISLPVMPGQPPQTVLPIQVMDGAGIPWLAGILYGIMFKSFVTPMPPPPPTQQQFFLTDILYMLFRKTQGWGGTLFEKRSDTMQAKTVFSITQRTGTSAAMIGAIDAWFRQAVAGYQPGGAAATVAAYPGYGAPPAVPYGYPAYAPPPPSIPTITAYAPAAAAAGLGMLKPPTGATPGSYYTIPQTASKTLLDTLKDFRAKLAIENSPAAIRAQALGGVPTRDRNIQTNLCQDPYWLMPNLQRVYPWATLQFLCVDDWATLTGDRSKVVFAPEWSKFINDMFSLYNGDKVPKMERTGTSEFLDTMKFTDINNLKVCAAAAAPRVKFKEVQDGLLKIQGIYERHVKEMWGILNSLVFLVEDPDTKTEYVRLHPKVLEANTSEEYVNDRAKEARKLISKFYYNIEKAYLDAAKTLQVA